MLLIWDLDVPDFRIIQKEMDVEYLPHIQLYPSLRNCQWPSGLVSVRKHLTASCSFISNAQSSSLHYFCTRSIESLIMCALTSARVCSVHKHVLSTSSSLNVAGAPTHTHCRKKSAGCLHGSQKTDKRGTALSGEDRNHCSRGKLLTGLWWWNREVESSRRVLEVF